MALNTPRPTLADLLHQRPDVAHIGPAPVLLALAVMAA